MPKQIVSLTLTVFLILIIVSSQISDARHSLVRSSAPGGYTGGNGITDLKGFDCDNGNGKSIPKFQLCNLVDDCGDGSDEDESKCRKLCSSDPSGDECINELCYLNSTRVEVEGGGGVIICTNLSIENECKRIHQSKVSGAFYCRIGECVPLNATCYFRSDCMVNGGKASCQKTSELIQTTDKTVIETGGDEVEGNGTGTWGWAGILVIFILAAVLGLGVLRWKLWHYIDCHPPDSYTGVNTGSYEWVPKSDGTVHHNPVSAGKDTGSDTHVIRVPLQNENENELVPGKIHNGRVLIPYKGEEVVIYGVCGNVSRMGNYEVLTDPKNVLKWVSCSRLGGIPGNAVHGGSFPKTHESDLEFTTSGDLSTMGL